MSTITVNDFERYAKKHLPKSVYDYYASGAEEQITLQRNRDAYSRYMNVSSGHAILTLVHLFDFRVLLMPNILVNVRHVSLETSLLGMNISSPIMAAPTAMQRMAHPDGELATSRGAHCPSECVILNVLTP
jgi:(S)-2-hydroxy-acid oxidase